MPKKWHIYWFSQLIVWFLFKIFLSINKISRGRLFFSVRGENIELLEEIVPPCLFTSNHKTYVDHFFVLVLFSPLAPLLPARGMAADWLFNVGWYKGGFLLRWGLKALGAFPTHRSKERTANSISVSLRHPLKVLQKGGSVMIYPEGGIFYRKGLREKIYDGATRLAQAAVVPIVPIGIRGHEFLSFREFVVGRRNIVIRFGRPFFVDSQKPAEVLTHELKEILAMLYKGKDPVY